MTWGLFVFGRSESMPSAESSQCERHQTHYHLPDLWVAIQPEMRWWDEMIMRRSWHVEMCFRNPITFSFFYCFLFCFFCCLTLFFLFVAFFTTSSARAQRGSRPQVLPRMGSWWFLFFFFSQMFLGDAVWCTNSHIWLSAPRTWLNLFHTWWWEADFPLLPPPPP